MPVIASGGLSQHRRRRGALRGAEDEGIEGVICGRAIYEGELDFEDGAGAPPTQGDSSARPDAMGLAKRIIPCLDVTARPRRQGRQLRRAARRRRPGRDRARATTSRAPTSSPSSTSPRLSDERDLILHIIEAVAVAGVHPADRRRRRAHGRGRARGCSTPAPTRSASTPRRSQNPELVARRRRTYGAQCIVVAIDAKRRAATAAGRSTPTAGARATGLDAVEWAQRMAAARRGRDPADQHGPRRHRDGFDLALTRAVSRRGERAR